MNRPDEYYQMIKELNDKMFSNNYDENDKTKFMKQVQSQTDEIVQKNIQ